jgi:hypothetical protein
MQRDLICRILVWKWGGSGNILMGESRKYE